MLYNTRKVLIIGAGLGGLTVGAFLSKNMYEVTVLEQHYVQGGYATCFSRKGNIKFEVSLHSIGDLDEGGKLRTIMEELGAFERLDFVKTNNLYVAESKGIKIEAVNRDQYIKVLTDMMPSEKDNIISLIELFIELRNEILLINEEKNMEHTVDLFECAPLLLKYYNYSLDQMLAEFTDSHLLKELMAQYWMYFGLPINELSAVFYAYVWTEYFLYGGHYPIGGSQSISDVLQTIIEENNGSVFTGERVDKILLEDKKAIGVETVKGKKYYADIVLSNVSVFITVEKLVGTDYFPKRYLTKVLNQQPSLSNVQLYLYLDIDIRCEFGEVNHEIFVNESPSIEEAYKSILADQPEKGAFCITYYDNIAYPYNEPNHSTISIFQLSDYQNWIDLEHQAYKEKKSNLEAVFIDKLEQRLPGIKAHIVHKELSTPLTNERYTSNKFGSIYGAAQNVQQSLFKRLPAETPIENLYLVGAWSQPGGGYSGTIWSGYNLGKKLLRK